MNLKTILQGKSLPHPLHPALVHLPIGLWTGSFFADVISFFVSVSTAQDLVKMSFYLILGGVIFAVPAAVTGFAEFLGIQERHGKSSGLWRLALTHMILVDVALVGYIGQLFIRDRFAMSVSGTAFLINLLCVVVLGVGGFFGGRLVFGHQMGMRSNDDMKMVRDGQKSSSD